MQTYQQDNASVISIRGNFKGSLLTEFEGQLDRAYREDRHIVLDLAQTAYFGLDSVGLLVHLAKMMKRRKRELWLVAMPPHGLRVLRAARMSHYFVSTSNVSDALYRIKKAENQLLADGIVVHSFIQVELLKDWCRGIVTSAKPPESLLVTPTPEVRQQTSASADSGSTLCS